MATYTARGSSHSIIYWIEGPEGRKQHWETYTLELEAMQRKAYIDYLQKTSQTEELFTAAMDYKQKRAAEKAASSTSTLPATSMLPKQPADEDNTQKTYREFVDKWLPAHARKRRFSPTTYDGYTSNLKNHILPYFGDRVMSTIKAEDIDDFLDHLSQQPCRGSKCYNVLPGEVPMLSSSVSKKCYMILTSGFRVAKKWRYITEIPETNAPAEKWKKRNAWDPQQVFVALDGMKDNKLLHLAVHIAFVCSLRAGEVAGLDIKTVDMHDCSLWITRQVQRASDESLGVLPPNEVIRIFPKHKPDAKSSLILKGPKTEGSYRKQYLTAPLLHEIRERLEQIQRNKEFFGAEYQDYGLLLCHPDGRPIDPDNFVKWFKDWQDAMHIEDQIEFQGLRKSGQMHKVRLTKNNYQLVAENSGQSPEVLMSNYNEALESEKRALAQLVESSFYPQAAPSPDQDAEKILQAIRGNPALSQQILQVLLSNAVNVP